MKFRLAFLLYFGLGALPAFAGPDNIAPLARVKAVSEMGPAYAAGNITDGIIGLNGKGEWASQSSMTFWGYIDYPWVELEWENEVCIGKVVLYDRPGEQAHTAGGKLIFSDGSTIEVTQIPNNGRPRLVSFSPKKVKWLRFETTDGDGLNLGLSEIEVFPSFDNYPDHVSWVDPYIESARGRYFFFVTGSQPFGMISAAPMTRNKNQYGGGYNYNSTEILGFPQVHCWMLSGLSLMPTTGEVNPTLGEQGWKSEFSHDDEIVQPGYHRLFLEDHGIWVEQTATDRASFYRLTYTKDAPSRILLNLGGYLATATMTDASVSKVSERELEGSFNTTGRLWGGPEDVRIFFTVHFSRPFEQMDSWNGAEQRFDVGSFRSGPEKTARTEGPWSYYDAPTAGVSAGFQARAGEQLLIKVAISYTSIENARNNLRQDCDHWDFDKVRRDSRKEWNEWLGRIDVKGGSPAQKVKLYTDLWHVLLGRHKLDDFSGDYPDHTEGERRGSQVVNAKLKTRALPRDEAGKVKYHMYNSDAFWLTQWNLNILWGLAWPEVQDEFAACLVQYAENGGLLPRGPCAGGYSFIMTTCPATNLITSAFQKGILTKKEVETAYETMKRNHMPGGMMEIDERYIEKGYHPGNAGITVEAAFQDWALSQMAGKLGKTEDQAYFLKRSGGWKALYNPKHKLLFPKGESGSWLHDDPLSGQGWVEANAWQATWSVSHDIPGLAALMGGADTLCAKLNFAFEQAAPENFVFGYSNGYVSYANQPGCSNAHVFNYAGQPWLSQYWVRRVKEQAYGAVTPSEGYGGHDEDQGQMGGVSTLMAIGLFSLQGTSSAEPVYEITSPLFDEVNITLDPRYYPGGQFTIKTYDNSAENCYIQRAQLNGKPLDQCWFYHKDFARGGLLEIWLGPEPNRNWGLGR